MMLVFYQACFSLLTHMNVVLVLDHPSTACFESFNNVIFFFFFFAAVDVKNFKLLLLVGHIELCLFIPLNT